MTLLLIVAIVLFIVWSAQKSHGAVKIEEQKRRTKTNVALENELREKFIFIVDEDISEVDLAQHSIDSLKSSHVKLLRQTASGETRVDLYALMIGLYEKYKIPLAEKSPFLSSDSSSQEKDRNETYRQEEIYINNVKSLKELILKISPTRRLYENIIQLLTKRSMYSLGYQLSKNGYDESEWQRREAKLSEYEAQKKEYPWLY